jgi:hypothetical protein
MIELLLAVLGACFTALASLALGFIFLRSLCVSLTRLEEFLFAFFSGCACFSLLIFLLTALHGAYTPVFVAAGLVAIAVWLKGFGHSRAGYETVAPIPKLWLALAIGLCLPYTLLYVSHALAPEYSYDGYMYHLALVGTYFREHHFRVIRTNMYASLPEGLEMLYLAAFSIGRHSAAATTHLLLFFATAIAIVSFGLRFQVAKAAIAAMVLFYLAPIVGYDGCVSYNDVALAGATFMVFYALQLWALEPRQDKLLLLAGIAAGFAAAIKYTGFMAPLFAAAFVLWKSVRNGGNVRRRLVLVVVPAAILIAPWLVKNAIEVHNPLSPFANRIFPNPYVHISFEEGYRHSMAHLNNVTLSEIPVEVTLKGARIQGLIGPVFLLAPIALFALASPLGRQVLLAFAIFLLPYFGNIGTRFLIPSLPFLCLGLSMILASWRACLIPVLLFHWWASWPSIVKNYAPYANGPDAAVKVRWDEAVRQNSEYVILWSHIPGYGMARYIDEHLPLSARILQFDSVPGAYMRQQIDSFYTAAKNEKATYLLWSGVLPDRQPIVKTSFHFRARPLRSILLEQNGAGKEELWRIADVHVYLGGVEIRRNSDWRIDSRPFPWDAGLAFDSDPLTVWQSWEHLKPGMFIRAGFGKPESVDQVDVIGPPQKAVRVILKGESEGGEEVVLSREPVATAIPLPAGYIAKIGPELKRLGYTHLVIGESQPCYKEIVADPKAWGMRFVVKLGEDGLFALD